MIETFTHLFVVGAAGVLLWIGRPTKEDRKWR